MKYLDFFKLFFTASLLIFIISCNKDDFDVTAIVLEAAETEVIAGASFSFTVKGDNNKDVTSDATFKVDGNVITGNSFISDSEPKTYLVQAFYNSIESEIIEVITAEAGDFIKNVLVEDYTGTWCGWCPRVSYAIHQAKQDETYGDKVVAVAIHVSEGANIDPYSFDKSMELRYEFIPGFGLPQGRINRANIWTAPEPDNLDELAERTGFSKIGIAIESEIESSNINGTINVSFLEDYNEENINLVIYLVENGLHHDQHNYTADLWSSGYEDPLENFEQNDVLRAVYTSIHGIDMPNAEQIIGNTYSYEFSGSIPSSVENNAELVLIAFVVDADTNQVLNIREGHLGITQEFQVAE